MFVKNIQKIGIVKKLMLTGLMLNCAALVRPAAAKDTPKKNPSNQVLIDEVNLYKRGHQKKIGYIGIFGTITPKEHELLSKLDKEYAIYYEILKKELEQETKPFYIEEILKKLNHLLKNEADCGKADAIDRIKLLLECNAQIDFCFEFRKTPLCMAAQNGHRDIVQFLIKNRATVDLPSHHPGETPLLLAAQNGHASVVECLIKNRANVNLLSDRKTALYVAAQNGHAPVVQCLTKNRANVNLLSDNETALYVAARKGHTPVVECLLTNRADVNLGSWSKTPFFTAAENGHLLVIKCLQKHNAKVNQPTYCRKTPFLIAIEKGHNDIVAYLEEAGEKITDLQETLLEAAGDRNGLLTVDYLIKKRADVNYISKDDHTALYKAIYNGSEEIVEKLITVCADINLAGPRGRTPLCAAIDTEFQENISILLNAHCLQRVAPFTHAIKISDAQMKQQKDGIPPSTNPTLNTCEISTLEKLPPECLWLIVQNLSPKSIGRFRQSSRTCKNAAEYEYNRQLRNALALKKQDFETLIKQTWEHTEQNREFNRGMEFRPETIALLQAASQRDFWQAALEAQPVHTYSEVMTDEQYDQSCTPKGHSAPSLPDKL